MIDRFNFGLIAKVFLVLGGAFLEATSIGVLENSLAMNLFGVFLLLTSAAFWFVHVKRWKKRVRLGDLK